MMLGVDLDDIRSIDPSYSKGIHTIVIAKLGMISLSIGLSRRMECHNPGMANKNGSADLSHL